MLHLPCLIRGYDSNTGLQPLKVVGDIHCVHFCFLIGFSVPIFGSKLNAVVFEKGLL